MKTLFKYAFLFLITSFITELSEVNAQKLQDFRSNGSPDVNGNIIRSEIQFNGYTNHWWNYYKEWLRYGNLFKTAVPDVEKTIVQNKIDIAGDLKLPGLWMQEGFVANWLSAPVRILDNPGLNDIETAANAGNVLILCDPSSETGKLLSSRYTGNDSWRKLLKSYQFNDPGFIEINAFMLENGSRKLFVISSTDKSSRDKVKDLLDNVRSVISGYEMHKGWFGVETLLKSVTITPGHPLEIIGKGMNEGNTWFVFSGYMEFLAKGEYESWISRTNMPVIADFGYGSMYGLENYDGLQVQDMPTKQSWIDYAHAKKGYIFRPVYDPSSDNFHYDGCFASSGDKFQIDMGDVPFVTLTGGLLEDLTNSMILFIRKGEKFTREKLWEAIMNKHEVAVLENGVIMGPEAYRTAVQMLLLDRSFLENYFNDRIDLQARMEGYTLNLAVTNTYPVEVSGKIDVQLPKGVVTDENLSVPMTIPANSSKTFRMNIRPEADGMNTPNPIVAGFEWIDKKKYTMCVLDMPPAISVHKILYGHSPVVKYPVTVHNFTREASYPVTVAVFDKNKPGRPVFTTSQIADNGTGTFKPMVFDLKLPAGQYNVEVQALGVKTTNQLGVGKATGAVQAYALDLNADGINEYRMENDSVSVTLLATGARVIEYIVKSRNDNVLFKLWPEKSGDDKRPNRSWGYYPYGGFEDFLGQASMETHKVYDAELVKGQGDYVQVRMVADFYGNKIEKIFTLYGNSPLLEVRYALTFKYPEANVLGPQPILELGKVHGTEDVFTVPTMDGLLELRMRPEDYYGRALKVKEGWNAGYDTKEDISFIGAFPVTQPIFLHMWMNHPRNNDAHHYYVEFQPWTPIYQQSTMYFTYYLWGAGGRWEASLKELRNRNLISTR
jgi:hypothetical protein